MPVPLILCRLKEDHSVTQLIGETALLYFQEWEPVPDQPGEPASNQAEPTPSTAAEPAKAARAKSSKAGTSATNDEE